MSNTTNAKAGLDALLTPDNCVLILIDHQPFQFAGLRSHDTQTVINNVVGLAKSAKIFGVPTLFTTVVQDRGGYLLKQLQDVFPSDSLLLVDFFQDPTVASLATAISESQGSGQDPMATKRLLAVLEELSEGEGT